MGAREVIQALNDLGVTAVGDLLGLELPSRGMARCPFSDHSDNKPSFEVRGGGRRWICYSCDRYGGAIDLVMTVRGLSFLDARRWLAQRSGIRIDGGRTRANGPARQLKGRPPIIDREAVETPPDHAIYAAYAAIAPLVASGRQYLRRRAFEDAVIARFGVGQAPGIDAVRTLIGEFGFERVRAAGLLIQGATPERPKPIFPPGALVFPYFEAGSIAYLQARLIVDGINGSRWRNLNHRRRRLYNVDVLAQPDIRRVAICEGAIDVLSATQLGWDAVGLIGVSAQLTEPQIISLRRRQVDLLLDWDPAGEKRAVRLQSELARYGVATTRKTRPSTTAGDVNDYLREVSSAS